jgi:DNA-binding transcriptional MerR regulator
MIFLIEYDRDSGRLVGINSFSDSDRERAEELRLRLELDLNVKGIKSEVVLLEAEDEGALRRTHRRYFENLSELTVTPSH